MNKKRQNAIAIKALLEKNIPAKQIMRQLGVTKKAVYYWKHHDIQETHYRKSKLPIKYIKEIVSLAQNQPTSEYSSRKLTRIINKHLEKDKVLDYKKEQLKISHMTVNRILNKFLEKPRKIRKVFYLSPQQEEKRVEFCKMILDKKLTEKSIFFTDETQIDLCNFVNDSIRLSKENQEKLKNGDLDVYNLITRPKKKFEKSIMVAGGISFNGLGKLMLLNGTENEFCYAQAILYYKDDINRLNKNLIFEQDGASPHTSKANKALLNETFGENWIQNPPNSPDMAYPIERLWGIIKNRVKRRNPKDIEELKNFMFEEWYSVPQTLVENLCKNYIKKIKKILELNGARLEQEHLNQIRDEEGEYGDGHVWQKKRFKIITIYNDEKLLKHKNKRIAFLNKCLKKISSVYKSKKKDTKNPLRGKKSGVVTVLKKFNKKIVLLKKEQQNQIKKEIDDLKKMDLLEYLDYLKKKEKEKEKKEKKEEKEEEEEEEENEEEENKDDESTIDEAIEKILKLNQLQEKNNNIEYNLAF